VDAGDVVAGLGSACGGDGRVDAAGHRGEHPHRRTLRHGRRGLDGRADRLDEGVDVLGGGVAQREAQRATRLLVGAAHRQQHVGGLRHAGRAGRAGGALDALGVEQHQQRVALAARGTRGARCRAAGARDRRGPDASGTASSTPRPGRRAAPQIRRRDSACSLTASLDRGGEAGDRRGVDRAAADVALLAAAVQQRGELELAAYDEGADAEGAADLVAGHGHRVDAAAAKSTGTEPEGLHGVGVHRDAVLGREGDDLVDRLHGADLVVGPHDRDQATDSGSTAIAAASAATSSRQSGPTGSSSTSAPSCSASHCSGSRTAWCSTAVVSRVADGGGTSRAP
jgi:hypothetical protein